MNCLIIDDNAIARSVLKNLFKIEDSLKLIAECENAADAFKILANNKIDLLLLDVEMPRITGIELVKVLGDKRPLIVFISSKRDYASDAYDLNVVDFIAKPITPDRFLKAIIKAKEIYKNQNLFMPSKKDEFIFIRDSNIIRRIKLADINYLEAKGDYVKIYMDKKNYATHSSLKSVEDKLPMDMFSRVHRSLIVNISKIDTIEGGTLIIQQHFVSVSDAYKSSLNKRMQIL
ncbi:LytTR family DNA-binding domain-containing protein [Pedobacter sp. MC2016-05]|uniref:LytR/AlgR family response regulator transcription factor n=1 Tax=Pedobacter sp. MC2016-05 TaxID=2994474 RepID=UPI002245913A|nr:LytTR family DNA-binding domain-containing protein [Pedobacter sp. MC2016-05]MCX2475595.1 LytTR family DNA-binding domain-containing protein [Pedobacter sp. MC2016-05]